MFPSRAFSGLFACWLVSSVLAHVARAQCPDWDPSLALGGMGSDLTKSIVYDDGTGPALYAVGTFTEASGTPAQHIARWDGAHWRALPHATGEPTSSLYALHVWDDGTGPALYVGGAAWGVNNVVRSMARWNGSTWSTFPNGPIGTVLAIEDFGGSLYVGGSIPAGIARWTGSVWGGIAGVSDNAAVSIRALRVFDDGTGPALYAGGSFAYAGNLLSPNLARWDGSGWSALAQPFSHPLYALTVFDSGSGPKLVAAGLVGTGIDSVQSWSGAQWTTLGASFNDTILDLEVFDDPVGGAPTLCAAGPFSTVGGVAVQHVARFDNGIWSSMGSHADGTVRDLLDYDLGSGHRLLAGGEFHFVSGGSARRVAQFDGHEWSPLETETLVLDVSVDAMTHFDDGHGDALYAAGTIYYFDTVEAASVVRWDGTSWTRLSSGASGQIRSLCVYDDGAGPRLYAGGHFSSIGGVTARSFARWNGTQWEALPTLPFPDFQVDAMVVHDDGSGTALYVGGTFSIARWRGGVWSALGPGLSGTVYALGVHDDGSGPKLIAGGYLSNSGSFWFNNLAQWDGSSWSNVAGGIPPTPEGPFPRSLLSFDDGSGPALCVGGRFVNAGGTPATNIALLKNGAWSALGSGTDNDVAALTWFDDGTGHGPRLYAAGYFATAGGVAAHGIARWDGAGWSALDGGVSNQVAVAQPSVHALATWKSGSRRDLLVGGAFESAGPHSSRNFARFEGCDETGRTFCFGDGSGAACPCGNDSLPGDRAGCLHSFGYGATLRASGEPQLSGDTLVLHGASMTNSAVLYFQGVGSIAGGAGAPFGDGLRCLSGPFVRMATKVNLSGASTYPVGSDVALSVRGAVLAPGKRTYQARYRNSAAFCTAETFNYTNAVEILWVN